MIATTSRQHYGTLTEFLAGLNLDRMNAEQIEAAAQHLHGAVLQCVFDTDFSQRAMSTFPACQSFDAVSVLKWLAQMAYWMAALTPGERENWIVEVLGLSARLRPPLALHAAPRDQARKEPRPVEGIVTPALSRLNFSVNQTKEQYDRNSNHRARRERRPSKAGIVGG